jgi:hypothetical protein
MNDKNNLKTTDNLTGEQQKHLQEIERRVNLIYDADITNPEAVKLWNEIKNENWIKPEIKEKWEKALKNK